MNAKPIECPECGRGLLTTGQDGVCLCCAWEANGGARMTTIAVRRTSATRLVGEPSPSIAGVVAAYCEARS